MRFKIKLMRTAFGCLIVACWTAAASAACRDDLIKADQDFSKSRSALNAAASAAPAAKCAAYRRHVASLGQVSKVFARCDTSANKAKNVAQTNTALADFTRQMNDACKK
ncbi:MAG: hypothetical protein WDO17_19065 [Alphaproteobacteria bacterium]